MNPQPARDTSRLFFALWPSDETRTALTRYAEDWQWPPTATRVRAENFHITLHFLGSVERSRLPDLLQLSLPSPPFSLRFGYAEVWPHGIVVLRPHVTPAALSRLQLDLGEAICRLGLIAERRDYQPHVTLARRATTAVAPLRMRPAIDWSVDRFVLIESIPRSQSTYTVLAEYPLASQNLRKDGTSSI